MRRIELSPPPCSTESILLFEWEVAKATGTKYALATSSGTAAIHLALLALGVGPGDVVLCSTLTFCASANPIVYCGATPVFIDCDLSMQIDPEEVRLYLEHNPPPKALIAVDLYGSCCDYAALQPICAKYGVPIIEDAAEALGATRDGKKAGSFGKVGIISFNLNKIVTATGGGMLVSYDPELIETARFFATQAKAKAQWYEHKKIGYNYRMASAVASHGVIALEQLEANIQARQQINEWYRLNSKFPIMLSHLGSTYWLTVMGCDNPEKAQDALAAENIEARRVWKPLHLQPSFAPYCKTDSCWMAGATFRRRLCLPSIGIDEDDVRRICRIVEGCL